MIGFSFPWRKESILTSFSSFLLSFLPSFLSSFLLPSFFSSLPPSILQTVDKLGTTQSTCMPRVRAVDVPCVHHMRTLLQTLKTSLKKTPLPSTSLYPPPSLPPALTNLPFFFPQCFVLLLM